METNDTGFYVIIREDDLRLKRHARLAGAEKEMARLAEASPGVRFFMLATDKVASVAPKPSIFRDVYMSDRDIPF